MCNDFRPVFGILQPVISGSSVPWSTPACLAVLGLLRALRAAPKLQMVMPEVSRWHRLRRVRVSAVFRWAGIKLADLHASGELLASCSLPLPTKLLLAFTNSPTPPTSHCCRSTLQSRSILGLR